MVWVNYIFFLGGEKLKARLNKEEIKKMYLDGFNAPEIAKKIKEDKDTIKKCIQRNFKDFRLEHEIAAVRRREVIKAINYESTKFMGDSTFIRKNRSIYKTNLNGDIVINKHVAPVVTWDTPRRLTNENKIKQ